MTTAQVMSVLAQVTDPEIPVLSIVDLGIVEKVSCQGRKAAVALLPTFAGCPALELIRRAVSTALHEAGAEEVEVTFLNSPPWTTDRISEAGLRALGAFGIAGPGEETPRCPYCQSQRTRRESAFGPTLCRAVYYCDACQQPFERIKPLLMAERAR